MKNILVLGAGLVSKPLVVYLLKKDFKVKVASRTVSKAEALIKGFKNGVAEKLDIHNEKKLEKLISESDLVVSLVPYIYHLKIAKLCIQHKKHMVTTSYVSEEMQQLHEDAISSDILILNEIGLDPGIDHMSAMKIIHEAEKKGGKIVCFKSYCGGLPALQSNTYPFRYKFSWSPRGVVLAGKNNGQYLEDNQIIFIPSRNLFKHYEIIDVAGIGSLEAYTNRDALPYQKLYGLKDAKTVFRGTLRNVGWCYTMKKAQELGLFDDSPREDLKDLTYRGMILKLIGLEESNDIIADTSAFLGLEQHATVIKKLKWIGLFDDELLPDQNNVMDMFSDLLQKRLVMEEDDLDLIVLYHRFIIKYKGKNELVTSTLIETGLPKGDSAMSRTVSLPAAIASAMILNSEIKLRGVQIPVHPSIYKPVLAELENMDLKFVERQKPM